MLVHSLIAVQMEIRQGKNTAGVRYISRNIRDIPTIIAIRVQANAAAEPDIRATGPISVKSGYISRTQPSKRLRLQILRQLRGDVHQLPA